VKKYVLTERGKFTFAILLIVLFLILPSLLLAVWALTTNTSNELNQNGKDVASSEAVEEDTPDLSEDALDGEDDDPAPVKPPLTDSITFDLDAGVMVFLYSPETQTTLDENTFARIGEILTSPKNTSTAKIVVEIPQLDDDNMLKLTTAVTDAFAEHGVSINDIIFLVYESDPDALTFKISITFQ